MCTALKRFNSRIQEPRQNEWEKEKTGNIEWLKKKINYISKDLARIENIKRLEDLLSCKSRDWVGTGNIKRLRASLIYKVRAYNIISKLFDYWYKIQTLLVWMNAHSGCRHASAISAYI